MQIHNDIQEALQLLETKTTEQAEVLDLRLVIIIEAVEQPVLHTEPTPPTEAQEAIVEQVDRAQEALIQAIEELQIVLDHTQHLQEAVATVDLRPLQEAQEVTEAAVLLPEAQGPLEAQVVAVPEALEVLPGLQVVHVVVEAEVADHNMLKTIPLI
ncbi:hypothetical protein SAMN05216294_1587 [Flagellimonas zhangzhouensis]|uniref:Uncharacterized protein n=1 Tax=Flagellimonas zhangzhouensis TaxID=1073328 RepID=A0A1H2QJN1_9FLAO|nr:hypothetical protein SAMN05216294_1587 [Allomuricauda zhangzhouensis]SDW06874.1 hypothetical protein SAMN04487892_0238 [Allomuricauda zhangzhouensis]